MNRIVTGICATWLAAAIAAAAAPGDEDRVETLFLRDGSVVRGVVVPGADQTMLVDGSYGALTVREADVLVRIPPQPPEPLLAETYVFGASATGAVVTMDRPVPEPASGATTFSLLLPGKALEVRGLRDETVPFEATDAGAFSRVVVRHSDVPKGDPTIRVTTQVDDALEILPDGTVEFAQKYAPDRAGRARIVAKYPGSWRLRLATPELTTSTMGVAVWDLQLRRQQSFAPRLQFAR